MSRSLFKPASLTLAIGVALSLAACGNNEAPPATPAGAASSAPTRAASTVASASTASTPGGFDISRLGPPAEACQDFAQFVNAKWNAANPIPADETRWGSFAKLGEESRIVQHQIVEDAAKNVGSEKSGSIKQKIGDLYKSGMDDGAIDKAGFDPIKPKLDAIAGLKNRHDVENYLDQQLCRRRRPGLRLLRPRRLQARRPDDWLRRPERLGFADQGLLHQARRQEDS